MESRYQGSSKDDFSEDTQIYSYDLEESEDIDENTNKRNFCPEINRNLIIYKAFYFLFFGAVGALFPYLVVFYKQLWLSAHQVGILIGLRPFIQMCASPLWGVLADTYNVSKWILLMSIGAWLVSNFSISLVKPTEYETGCDLNLTYLPLSDYMDDEDFHWPRIEGLISKKHNLTKPQNEDYVDRNYSTEKSFQEEMANTSRGENKESYSLFATRQHGRGRHYLHDNSNRNKGYRILKGNDRRNYSTIIKILRTMFKSQGNLGSEKLNASKARAKRQPSAASLSRRRAYFAQLYNTSDKKLILKKLVHLLHGLSKRQTRHKEQKHSGIISKLKHMFRKREKRTDEGEKFENDFDSEDYLEEISNTDSNGGFYADSLLPNQRILETGELKEEFDSLKAPGELFWPLDEDMDATNSSDSANNPSKIQEAQNLFHVLLAITICGTILSSPAATLADTATLQALGKSMLIVAGNAFINANSTGKKLITVARLVGKKSKQSLFSSFSR